MKEDNLTNKIIEFFREDYDIEKIVPEKHYNYYGDRGIVDLFVRYKVYSEKRDHVFEIKSNPTNANEVLRQFNRMKKYFYKGTDLQRTRDPFFELCFTPTAKNLRHFKENKEMYREVEGFVSMRAPENVYPIMLDSTYGGESNLSNYREINNYVGNYIISTADMVDGKISLEISDI